MNAMDHEVNALRDDLHSGISDASKEANGCRYRIDISLYTTSELMVEYEYWCKRANEAWEEQKSEEARTISEWEQNVSDVMEMCNCNRFDAIYHILDGTIEGLGLSMDELEWDPDYFNYHVGLPYRFDFIRGEQAPYNKFSTSNAWRRTA